jgi:myo-inositol 2-dehydrogenase/D-chiro-inositol 1-dehydrogenase
MLNIAVIGAGRIGNIHARNMAANGGVRLAGLADIDAAAASRLVEPCGAAAMVQRAASSLRAKRSNLY